MIFITMKGKKNLIGGVALLALLTGCASPPIPVNYAPSSVKSASGTLSVADFNYFPASPRAPNQVQANQIRNTAIGDVKIDRNVDKFVRDAVFAELRVIGFKTNDPSRVLTGDIEEFLIDDLGYSVDWTLRIKYTLTDTASKTVLFVSTKNTQRKTAKFVNSFGAINETIKLNVEQLIDDASFIKATS